MLEEAIHQALDGMGIVTTRAKMAALIRHAELVLETNAEQNLTRIVEPDDVALLHVADSLAALPYLEAAPKGRFADLGSGGGYPGVPLAIITGRPVTLVESRGGKAAFLSRVIESLGLDGDVRPVRAEELAECEAGAFAAVTARAVAQLPALVELAAPLLVRGGELVALKGEPSAEEVSRGDAVAAKTGMVRVTVDRGDLPCDVIRTIVVYRRTGRASVRLPRRPGMAQRHPLA